MIMALFHCTGSYLGRQEPEFRKTSGPFLRPAVALLDLH